MISKNEGKNNTVYLILCRSDCKNIVVWTEGSDFLDADSTTDNKGVMINVLDNLRHPQSGMSHVCEVP